MSVNVPVGVNYKIKPSKIALVLGKGESKSVPSPSKRALKKKPEKSSYQFAI
jgi:hypothetical protein